MFNTSRKYVLSARMCALLIQLHTFSQGACPILPSFLHIDLLFWEEENQKWSAEIKSKGGGQRANFLVQIQTKQLEI